MFINSKFKFLLLFKQFFCLFYDHHHHHGYIFFFCRGGYIVKPSLIEFWQGQTNRLHDRIVFVRPKEGETELGDMQHQAEGGWIYQRLSPWYCTCCEINITICDINTSSLLESNCHLKCHQGINWLVKTYYSIFAYVRIVLTKTWKEIFTVNMILWI